MCSMEQGTKTTPAVEVWRPVVGWEGLYEVSNLARVRSVECDTIRYRNGKPITYHKRGGKVIKGKVMPNGYIMVRLHKDGEETNALAHRLVAQAFIPNPDNLPEINHKDGNRANNQVSNLEWCTAQENTIHSWRMGLAKPHAPSAEVRQRLHDLWAGKPKSAEHRAKIIAALKNRYK